MTTLADTDAIIYSDNPPPLDVVLVPVLAESHPGRDWPNGLYEVYINPEHELNRRSKRRLFELVVERLNVRGMSRPLEPMLITQENWEHAIGLVVCGLAERIQL
jgi:hypothetical protein